MIDAMIRFSIGNRALVLALALALTVAGARLARDLPIDVLPDLTAPVVTVMTDAHGMAPEEVETLITRPIENAVGGATGVRRVRSNSTFALSTVWIEFDDSADVYRARQVVGEKLALVAVAMPEGAVPVMAPVSSIMGEIMTIGMYGEGHTPMAVKEAADFVVRKRLLAVPGVSQVVTVGGETRQIRVEADPDRLAARRIPLARLVDAARNMNENFSAGVIKTAGEDHVVRGLGRIRTAEDVGATVVDVVGGAPVLMRDVADVKVMPEFRVGDTAVNRAPAVLLSVLKHPDANTLELTKRVERAVADLRTTLPAGMAIDTHVFRQSDFIDRAMDNVKRVLVEGALLVAIILVLFLGDFRTTVISLSAIPLSLVCTAFTFKILGMNLNTMTLGGIAIAIGVVVDDAIIDVENVFRRMRENARLPEAERRPAFAVVFDATREIRASIVIATVIVIMVFAPLFFLGGVEGRLLRPLGVAYIVSIAASLLVALTVTPALCALLLPAHFRGAAPAAAREGRVTVALKALYRPFLGFATGRPRLTLLIGAAFTVATTVPLASLGRSFLPGFNEGSLIVKVATAPGSSIEKSVEVASLVDGILARHPNISRTARKTGRGENDEHGKFPNESEIEATLDMKGRRLAGVMEELRASLAAIPGVQITFSQPISHRIDHMLSGTMANLAVKIFGPDRQTLHRLAAESYAAIKDVRGLVDLGVEQQADIPQITVTPDRGALGKYGLSIVDVAHASEFAVDGARVTKLLDGEKEFAVTVGLPAAWRESPEALARVPVDTPLGVTVPLGTVARIGPALGPNMVNRENGQRKLVIQANVAGRDLRGAVDEVRARIAAAVTLPEGYSIEYGGQFESEAQASRTISTLSVASLVFILLLLYMEFRSFKESAMVMVNLPLALAGGVLALLATGGVINVSSMVGFITLFGIATRNGILLVSHYHHLRDEEGIALEAAVSRGSQERLAPILMTALATGLALVPFALGSERPGNEILSPMAVVILGGLVTSTLLNMIMIPALYTAFGDRSRSPETV